MLSNNSRNRAGRRAAAAGSTSPLSHITCVTRAVHTNHFPGLASISINVRATMPTFHLPLACPGWRLLNLAQLYDSRRRLRDAALPTCLTCAKLKVWKLDDVKCPNTESYNITIKDNICKVYGLCYGMFDKSHLTLPYVSETIE